jgi:hypothetical protein
MSRLGSRGIFPALWCWCFGFKVPSCQKIPAHAYSPTKQVILLILIRCQIFTDARQNVPHWGLSVFFSLKLDLIFSYLHLIAIANIKLKFKINNFARESSRCKERINLTFPRPEKKCLKWGSKQPKSTVLKWIKGVEMCSSPKRKWY